MWLQGVGNFWSVVVRASCGGEKISGIKKALAVLNVWSWGNEFCMETSISKIALVWLAGVEGVRLVNIRKSLRNVDQSQEPPEFVEETIWECMKSNSSIDYSESVDKNQVMLTWGCFKCLYSHFICLCPGTIVAQKNQYHASVSWCPSRRSIPRKACPFAVPLVTLIQSPKFRGTAPCWDNDSQPSCQFLGT